jgi:hypothetical protein
LWTPFRIGGPVPVSRCQDLSFGTTRLLNEAPAGTIKKPEAVPADKNWNELTDLSRTARPVTWRIGLDGNSSSI